MEPISSPTCRAQEEKKTQQQMNLRHRGKGGEKIGGEIPTIQRKQMF